MRIAFLINDINVCGGTHKQFLKLLEYTERQGQDFIIITKVLDLDKTYPGFKRFKDKIIVIDAPSVLKHRYVCRLIKYYIKYKYRQLLKDVNIVNIHDGGFELDLACFEGKKVYWQVNDLPYAFHVGVAKNTEDNPWTRKFREITLNGLKNVTDLSVNVSKNAERVKECFGRDAHVFYCGVEPLEVIRDINVTLKRFQQKKINLLSSGVFFPYRNYETQVAVVKALIQKGYQVELHIIGALLDKEYAEKIHRMIHANHLEENIIIEGQVDDAKFRELHKNADIFLFINIDQSWGLAVFEAMSCGLPVIVSESVGAIEILSDNVDSIFVDPKDAKQISEKIISLASNEEYYRKVSDRASVFHNDWTWDKAYCSKMYNLMMK